jgi:hypothetical protein
MKIILEYRGPFFPEFSEFLIADRVPHPSEKFEIEVKIMQGVKSHGEYFPVHE